MAPTERSIPPVMMTKVIPTAMIAKKLVSLAIWTIVLALKNLLTDSKAGTFCPDAFVANTLTLLPWGFVSNFGSCTDPPNIARSNPSAIITKMRPPSGNFEKLKLNFTGDDIGYERLGYKARLNPVNSTPVSKHRGKNSD